MKKREMFSMQSSDYVFAIGFDGNSMIVDKKNRLRYRNLDICALVDAGLFQAACRRAILEDDEKGAQYVLEKYNAISPVKYDNPDSLFKMYGLHLPSADISNIRYV